MDEKSLFFTVIQTTISYGGSTNANAAVVGGLIGALVGYQNFEHLSGKVLTFDQDKEGAKRDEFLNQSKYLVKNIQKLIDAKAKSTVALQIFPKN